MKKVTHGSKLLLIAGISAALLASQAGPALALESPASTPVSQETPTLSADDTAYIEANFDKLNIPVEKRGALLAKIAAGELLDAESGVAPTSVERKAGPEGTLKVTSRFPDGSAYSTTEIPMGPMLSTGGNADTPYPVSGCSKSAVTGWTIFNYCFVDHQMATWSLSMRASYRNSLDMGARITSVSEARSGGIGVGSASARIIRGSVGAGGTALAEVRARQNITISGVPTSRDIGMRLNVPAAGSAYTTHWGS